MGVLSQLLWPGLFPICFQETLKLQVEGDQLEDQCPRMREKRKDVWGREGVARRWENSGSWRKTKAKFSLCSQVWVGSRSLLARRSWKSRRLEELIPSETSAALQAAPKKKRAKVKGRQRPTTAKTCWASGSFLGIKDVGKEEAECKCLRLQNELYFYPRWSLCLLPSCAQMRGSSEQELGSADDFSGAQMTRQPVKGTQMPAENHELTMAGRCSAFPWSAFHPCRILPDTCFSPKAAAGVKGRVLASFWTEVLSQCTWTRPGPPLWQEALS
jgi:hypothetical protein